MENSEILQEPIKVKKPEAFEIEKHYSSAMDSVNLINAGKPAGYTDEYWADVVRRNKSHLEIMLSKDYWTTEDLTPFQNAVK